MRYICKLKEFYFEWSTIVNDSVSDGMTLDEFREYHAKEHPDCVDFQKRIDRVENKGTSSLIHKSVDYLIPISDQERLINDFEQNRMKVTKINGIGNFYGSLHVKRELSITGYKYFMKVYCEVSNHDWTPIDKVLYESLIKFNNDREKTNTPSIQH